MKSNNQLKIKRETFSPTPAVSGKALDLGTYPIVAETGDPLSLDWHDQPCWVIDYSGTEVSVSKAFGEDGSVEVTSCA